MNQTNKQNSNQTALKIKSMKKITSAALSTFFVSQILSMSAIAKPVEVVFRLKTQQSMTDLAKQVMDKNSPRYQRFLTPEEIRQTVAPSDKEYQAFIRATLKRGMKVNYESKTHLFVSIITDDSNFENNFKTRFKREHGILAGVTPNLKIPDDMLLAQSISGLNHTHKLHRLVHFAKDVGGPGPGPKPSPIPVSQAKIKSSYGFNPIYAQGISGHGQDIAIATFGSFHPENIKAFFEKSHIVPAPVVDIINVNHPQVVDINNSKEDVNNSQETELDIEMSGMIAPGSKIHVFGSNTAQQEGDLLILFNEILDDNRSKIVNFSWGSCESNPGTNRQDMDEILARAVAQGVNIMVASGDSGADGCNLGPGNVNADWPASSPLVVAVGGTSLTINLAQATTEPVTPPASSSVSKSSTRYSSKLGDGGRSEIGWSNSGGGFSDFYALPDYQSQIVGRYKGGRYKGRALPDVSFNADPLTGEYAFVTDPDDLVSKAIVAGGTSMAAPQWAGFMALVGEARERAGKKPIGFINPILYSMPDQVMAMNFLDITVGNNGFSAVKGWDPVTGLGTPVAASLLDYLVAY